LYNWCKEPAIMPHKNGETDFTPTRFMHWPITAASDDWQQQLPMKMLLHDATKTTQHKHNTEQHQYFIHPLFVYLFIYLHTETQRNKMLSIQSTTDRHAGWFQSDKMEVQIAAVDRFNVCHLSPSLRHSVREYVCYVFFSDFKKTWLL